MATAIKSGIVWVNTYQKFDPGVPFGGYKMSGVGKELGADGIQEYLNTKTVWINTD
jgi:aldehyde dehydrogenase (NAD+)